MLPILIELILWLLDKLYLYLTEATPMQQPDNLNPDKFSSIQPLIPNYVEVKISDNRYNECKMKVLPISGCSDSCLYADKKETEVVLSRIEEEASKNRKNSPLHEHVNAKPLLVKGNETMGLQNIGQTCYFNSALNSLYFVPQFHHLFSVEEQPADPPLLSRLKQFVRTYGQKNLTRDLLTSIRHAVPSFRHEGMGSAYEFILGLLQRVDEEVESYVEMDSVPSGEEWERELARRKLSGCQPLHDIFSVVVEETLTCSKCYNFFSRYLYNRSFSIDLGASIENCLANYLSEVKRSEPYYCTCKVCKTAEVHTIKRSLKHIGTAIIIHLQRHHSSTPYTEVDVPESLNMSTYLQRAGTYWLCSAVHHSGTVASGHYTSYASTESGWMYFNDRHASFKSEVPRRSLMASTFFIYASA